MICLFGGTFDPVHSGHIHGAAAVCAALELPEVRLVLAARPGHRQSPIASAEHRWQMLRLACASNPQLVADDRELMRDTPSYTVETLSELRTEVGDGDLAWVLGSDAFADLPNWHRWTEVLKFTNLVILRRPGQAHAPQGVLNAELQSLCARHRVDHRLDAPFGQIMFLDNEMQGVSASLVRAALSAGQPVAQLLPDRVATYISVHGLYGGPSDP